METATTLPVWKARLATAHEHETIPVTKGKQPTTNALAAKMIRQTLARVFPGVSFTATSKSYSGGNSVSVKWTDGPTESMVSTVVARFQMGSFDGMQDLYEYTNRRDDLPQVRWVHTSRSYSRAAYLDVVNYLNRHWAGFALEVHPTENYILPHSDKHTGSGWQATEVWRYVKDKSLMCPACDSHTMPTDNYCELCGASLTDEVS